MLDNKEEMIKVDEKKYYLDLKTWRLFLEVWEDKLMEVNVMVSKP